MPPKSAAQLDREIAETLATPTLTAKRAKDFRDSGNYEVRDESGTLVALLYRDPESREWYEDQLPGSQQGASVGHGDHHSIARIARTRRPMTSAFSIRNA